MLRDSASETRIANPGGVALFWSLYALGPADTDGQDMWVVDFLVDQSYAMPWRRGLARLER